MNLGLVCLSIDDRSGFPPRDVETDLTLFWVNGLIVCQVNLSSWGRKTIWEEEIRQQDVKNRVSGQSRLLSFTYKSKFVLEKFANSTNIQPQKLTLNQTSGKFVELKITSAERTSPLIKFRSIVCSQPTTKCLAIPPFSIEAHCSHQELAFLNAKVFKHLTKTLIPRRKSTPRNNNHLLVWILSFFIKKYYHVRASFTLHVTLHPFAPCRSRLLPLSSSLKPHPKFTMCDIIFKRIREKISSHGRCGY